MHFAFPEGLQSALFHYLANAAASVHFVDNQIIPEALHRDLPARDRYAHRPFARCGLIVNRNAPLPTCNT
jgi:hypothetical protein